MLLRPAHFLFNQYRSIIDFFKYSIQNNIYVLLRRTILLEGKSFSCFSLFFSVKKIYCYFFLSCPLNKGDFELIFTSFSIRNFLSDKSCLAEIVVKLPLWRREFTWEGRGLRSCLLLIKLSFLIHFSRGVECGEGFSTGLKEEPSSRVSLTLVARSPGVLSLWASWSPDSKRPTPRPIFVLFIPIRFSSLPVTYIKTSD